MRLALALVVGLLVAIPAQADAKPFPTNSAWSDTENGYFATPSGRIVCGFVKFHGRMVNCTNFESGRDPATGQMGQWTWAVHSRGRATASPWISNAPTEDLPHAKYGVTYAYHGITCRVSKTRGIRCKNRSGHGFRVSVQKQTTF